MRLSKETQVRIYQFSPLESTGEFISFVLLLETIILIYFLFPLYPLIIWLVSVWLSYDLQASLNPHRVSFADHP